jgi:hypothetical protein
VDDPKGQERALLQLFTAVKAVLADVAHIMRRYFDTLTPAHPCRGETGGALGVNGDTRLPSLTCVALRAPVSASLAPVHSSHFQGRS